MARIGRGKSTFHEMIVTEENVEDNVLAISLHSDDIASGVDLILEPSNFEKLSAEARLTLDEYSEVINRLLDEEEDDWDTMRMKDQINMTRDALLQASILKYAKEQHDIDDKHYTGLDLQYYKRYDSSEAFIGEAICVSLVKVPEL